MTKEGEDGKWRGRWQKMGRCHREGNGRRGEMVKGDMVKGIYAYGCATCVYYGRGGGGFQERKKLVVFRLIHNFLLKSIPLFSRVHATL